MFGWDLFRPAEDTVRWRGGAVIYMVTKLQVFLKGDKCIDQLSDCQLVKKELFDGVKSTLPYGTPSHR